MNTEENLVPENYKFDLGLFLSEGWELFKKAAGSFIGFNILYIIIIFFTVFLIALLAVGISPFLFFIAVPVIAFIALGLYGGYYVFCSRLSENREDFGDFFKGFKYGGHLFLLGLMSFLLYIPLLVIGFTFFIPFDLFIELFSGQIDPEYFMDEYAYRAATQSSFSGIFTLVQYGYSFTLSVALLFAMPLIVINDLNFWTAMQTSWKTTFKKFFPFLGFVIVLNLIMMIGIIFTCGLGVFIAIPYQVCATYSAYQNVIIPKGSQLESEISEFGQESRDINTESGE